MTDEQYEHLFSVRRSIRYHSKREAYYSRSHYVATVVNFVAGTGAVIAALQNLESPTTVIALSALISAVSAVDIISNNARKSWLHSDLRKQFINLEAQQLRLDVTSNEILPTLMSKRLKIEAEEPPVHRALDIICHNELVIALGMNDDAKGEISIFKRLTAQWFLW